MTSKYYFNFDKLSTVIKICNRFYQLSNSTRKNLRVTAVQHRGCNVRLIVQRPFTKVKTQAQYLWKRRWRRFSGFFFLREFVYVLPPKRPVIPISGYGISRSTPEAINGKKMRIYTTTRINL